MKRWTTLALLCVVVMAVATLADAAPRVRIETNKGTVVVELYPDKAPKSVENFLQYVRTGHYVGTIFHTVINGYIVQGGVFDTDLVKRPTLPPIESEATNGLKNSRGTIAMARTAKVHSATDQFFFNLGNNSRLDHKDNTPDGFGYAVFGKVIEGLNVLDEIGRVPVAPSYVSEYMPKQAVIIRKVTLLDEANK